MAMQIFDIRQIGELDPAVVKMFNRLVAEAVKDCHARPGEKTAREVGLKMVITPVMASDGTSCDAVNIDFALPTKTPARRSKTYQMLSQDDGKIMFNPASPDQPRQRTLDEKD